jgi:hypothetical protein
MSAFWEEQKAIFWKQTMDLAIRQGEGAFVASNLSVQGLTLFTWMAYWKKTKAYHQCPNRPSTPRASNPIEDCQ